MNYEEVFKFKLNFVTTVLTVFSGGTVAQAQETQKDKSVTDKVDYLDINYDLKIQVEQGASSDDVMNELNNLEEKLQVLEQLSKQPKNVNIELTPSPLPNSFRMNTLTI